ncbi:hypothetical protein [Bifidobacterium sp. ESL0704]|uniref:hypothetical protein n=1 Tax=Bifidobacterium sp. ESL0704 TaxID=2983219 RepID=UPI0023F7F5FB|nr:hypothetical protein [Bifidobacterium sp. ESL0704]WEV52845.1 hypothetical protein OZX64_08320 [Bifidobacterium sp. ESL0704]
MQRIVAMFLILILLAILILLIWRLIEIILEDTTIAWEIVPIILILWLWLYLGAATRKGNINFVYRAKIFWSKIGITAYSLFLTFLFLTVIEAHLFTDSDCLIILIPILLAMIVQCFVVILALNDARHSRNLKWVADTFPYQVAGILFCGLATTLFIFELLRLNALLPELHKLEVLALNDPSKNQLVATLQILRGKDGFPTTTATIIKEMMTTNEVGIATIRNLLSAMSTFITFTFITELWKMRAFENPTKTPWERIQEIPSWFIQKSVS